MLGTACDRCAAFNVLRRDGVRKFLILHTERTLNKDNGSSPGKSRNRPFEVVLHFSGCGVNQASALVPSTPLPIHNCNVTRHLPISSFHFISRRKKTILWQKSSEVMDNSEVTCEKGMLNTVPHTL